MPLIDIGGVPVDFPFTPYDSQKDFMSKVVQALQEVSICEYIEYELTYSFISEL